MSRWEWLLRQLTRRLWIRASFIGAIGVFAAILAAVVERYIPWTLPGDIGADAVEGILDIIASSMLAVTTFSLSVMTSAYGSATSNVTPRATKLLIEDRVTQNVLSTFLGSFLFGIVGIVVLKTGAYGDRGRTILFLVTIGVIVLIVVTLLRWIDHLTRLGRVGETTDRVERAARSALAIWIAQPTLGGAPLSDAGDIPHDAAPVTTDQIGYVQHIDIGALADAADDIDGDIFLATSVGAFLYPETPLVFVAGSLEGEKGGEAIAAIRGAFSIGAERSFDQDPRFGLAVMSEIASRALSPATNDPGTAIDVIGRTTRLLALWGEGKDRPEEIEIQFPRVHVAPLDDADLFEDAFMLVARDGAGLIEVQLRIRKALFALAAIGSEAFRRAALAQAKLALARAEHSLALEADRARLAGLVAGRRLERHAGQDAERRGEEVR